MRQPGPSIDEVMSTGNDEFEAYLQQHSLPALTEQEQALSASYPVRDALVSHYGPLSGGVYPSDPRTTPGCGFPQSRNDNPDWFMCDAEGDVDYSAAMAASPQHPQQQYFDGYHDYHSQDLAQLSFTAHPDFIGATAFCPPDSTSHYNSSLSTPIPTNYNTIPRHPLHGPELPAYPYNHNYTTSPTPEIPQINMTSASSSRDIKSEASSPPAATHEEDDSKIPMVKDKVKLPWKATETIKRMSSSNGNEVHADIFKVDCADNFLCHESSRESEGYYITYRRNYLSVGASYALSPPADKETLHIWHGEGSNQRKVPVQALALSLKAVVDQPDGKSIELVQHTAKRDKGPRGDVAIVKLCPAQRTFGILGLTASASPCPELPLQSLPSLQTVENGPMAEPSQHQHTFERIQFKSATSNNGRRRAQQQLYHLVVVLYADVRDPNTDAPLWVPVARRVSDPLIVRGRSPGHYSAEDGRRKRRGGPSSGSGGAPGSAGPSTGGNHSSFAAPSLAGQSSPAGRSSYAHSSPDYESRPGTYNHRLYGVLEDCADNYTPTVNTTDVFAGLNYFQPQASSAQTPMRSPIKPRTLPHHAMHGSDIPQPPHRDHYAHTLTQSVDLHHLRQMESPRWPTGPIRSRHH